MRPFYHVKPVSVMFHRMIVLHIFILRLKRRRTTTKNTGTKKMARTVAVTIPPITPVPTAFCAPEPAPELITSGITPRINAVDVIRIGRRRIRTASSVASIRPLPSFSIRSLANSTISIAFFADKPMVVSRPTGSKRR